MKISRKELYQMFLDKVLVSEDKEFYLQKTDALAFVSECEKYGVPIYGIDIVSCSKDGINSPLDKTIEFHDQKDVYSCAIKFIEDEMDCYWNYAIVVN